MSDDKQSPTPQVGDAYHGGGWNSPEGRWSMSQPERKLARIWRPPPDVRVEHQKKIAHLTAAQRAALRESLKSEFMDVPEFQTKLNLWIVRKCDNLQFVFVLKHKQ